MKLLTFQEAIQQAKGKKHVLLGNGFSIACRADIFNYKALFCRADFSELSPKVPEAFAVLGTTDFEIVMEALKSAATLLRLYKDQKMDLSEQLLSDAEGLREVLVHAIADGHPEKPYDIRNDEVLSCREFLANFDNIYTLNYDLLLYWAIMNEQENISEKTYDDGFRMPNTGMEDYVAWNIEKTNKQNVFYMHGALHIFDAGDELKKFTWKHTGVSLIEQIRAALVANMYPMIVAEGTSKQKLAKINHSNYLSRAYRSFSNIKNSLFIFGHSFAESDDHILGLIPNGSIKDLFVSIFGDPSSDVNREIIEKATALASKRTGRQALNVHFYDASSANVWTATSE